MRFFVAFLTLALCSSVYCQGEGSPTLVDEFGSSTCEDVLARTDNFGIQLTKSKNSSGFVISRGDLAKGRMVWMEKFIHRALIGRLGNNLNVKFLRRPESRVSKIEMWVAPSGAYSQFEKFELYLQIPFEITTRTFFAAEGPGPCDGHIGRGFVEMLKRDPKLTGYVVNINSPKSERRETMDHFLDFLRENGLADKGIRIYFKNRQRRYGEHSYVEYWLMPRKR